MRPFNGAIPAPNPTPSSIGGDPSLRTAPRKYYMRSKRSRYSLVTLALYCLRNLNRSQPAYRATTTDNEITNPYNVDATPLAPSNKNPNPNKLLSNAMVQTVEYHLVSNSSSLKVIVMCVTNELFSFC